MNRSRMLAFSFKFSRRADGSLAVAVWNYAEPRTAAAQKTVTLRLRGVTGKQSVTIHGADSEHGSALAAYLKIGKPEYPTLKQIGELPQAAELVALQAHELSGDENQSHCTRARIGAD
jgi:xylan 1,4-beta-xylosidase